VVSTSRSAVFRYFLLLFPAVVTLISCSGSIPEESLARYVKAKEYYESGAFEEARQEFAWLSGKHRSFHQAAFMEGKATFFLGNVESAAEIFAKLQKRRPDHFDSAFWYARCLSQTGKHNEAEEKFLQLLSRNGQDPRILFQLALLSLEQEQVPEAIEYLRRAVLFGEELAMMLIRLGRVYYRYGMFDSALEELEKARVLLDNGHPLEEPIEILMETIREEAVDVRK
jgi:tetratricopeptide (TPR) repeat protein